MIRDHSISQIVWNFIAVLSTFHHGYLQFYDILWYSIAVYCSFIKLHGISSPFIAVTLWHSIANYMAFLIADIKLARDTED